MHAHVTRTTLITHKQHTLTHMQQAHKYERHTPHTQTRITKEQVLFGYRRTFISTEIVLCGSE
jgi:hypothetical protein